MHIKEENASFSHNKKHVCIVLYNQHNDSKH